MKQEKTGRWISSSYDGTYDCFIDNTYGHTYGYIIIWINIFSPTPSFKQYQDF